MGVELESTPRTEVVVAAVDRGASRTHRDTDLAEHRDPAALAQSPFERAQLGVEPTQCRELGEHELVVALAESVQVEHEAAEVAIGQLTRLAQKARATAHATPLAETRRSVG